MAFMEAPAFGTRAEKEGGRTHELQKEIYFDKSR